MPTDTSATTVAPKGFTATVRRLSQAQKPPATGSPAYSRFVNRRFGRVLAAAAFLLRMTPNQVTAVSALFSAVAVAVVALVRPTVASAVLVAFLLLLGYAFDSADGQLARLRGGGTPGGEWLDHVVDSVKVSALHLAVLIGWFRFWDVEDKVLLIPIAFTLASSVFFFVQILMDQFRRAHPGQAPAPADGSLRSVLRSLIVAPTDYGLLCILFALFSWREGFVVVYGLMLLGTFLFMLAALPKWFREASAMRPVGKVE